MKHPFKNPYFNAIAHLLEKIESTQEDNLQAAADAAANALAQGGVIHTFGCGHSGSVALEPFHRSGCFVPVNAILDPGLMFQLGAHAGTALERLEGYAPVILARHELVPGDVLFVVSNSGRNPAGIDAVLYAKERGVKTVALTAAGAHTGSRSRHSSGLLLKDAADIVLDNCAPANETALEADGLEVAPISTVAGCAVLHTVLYRAVKILQERGLEPPVYKSSNAANNDEWNTRLAKKYAQRIKHID